MPDSPFYSRPLRILLTGLLLMASVPFVGHAESGEGIQWAPSFDLALEQARAEKKIVMVDFFTHWCHWCKVLDEKTYSDPTVIEASRRMVNVKVNAGTYVDIAQKYGVNAYPTILFLKPDGTVRTSVRGFKPPERFLPQMENAMSVGGQILALKNQLDDHPEEARLRKQYVELLSLQARWEEAAAEVARLLEDPQVATSDEASSWTLDAFIYRLRAGEDVREGLESWRKSNRNHPRELEARFQLGQAHEAAGDEKTAAKVYQSVIEDGGKGWFGTTAGSRLQKMKEPGPKGT